LIIESIEMENVLSHRRTALKLRPGVTVIVGPNGSGKTSIIDAITYALFSTHSRDPHSRREAIIRQGSSFARISVAFSVGSTRYLIVKSVYKNQTGDVKLYRAGNGGSTLIASGARSVEAELRSIIGVDPKIADKLYVTRQGEVERLLLDREARLKLFNTIFKLESMKKAYERLHIVISKLQLKMQLLSKRLDELERDLRDLELVRTKYKETLDELNRLAAQEQDLEGELQRVEAEYRRLRELREVQKELQAEVSKLASSFELLQDELRRLEKGLMEKPKVERELSELEERIQALSKAQELHELYRKLQEMDKDLARKEEELAKVEEKLGTLQEAESLYLYLKYKEALGRVEELEPLYRRYLELKAKMERLEQEELAHEKRISNLVNAASKLLKEVLQADVSAETLDSAYAYLESLLSKLEAQVERYDAKLRTLESKIGEEKRALKDLEDSLEKITSAERICPLCRRPLDDTEWHSLLMTLRREKRDHEKELRRLEAEREQVRRERENARQQYEKLSALAREFKGIVETARYHKSRLEEVKKERQRLSQEYVELSVKVQDYISAKRVVDELRRQRVEERYAEYLQLTAARRRLVEEINALRTQAAQLRDRAASIAEALGIARPEDVEVLVEEHKAATERVGMLREKLRRLEADEARAAELRSRLREVEAQLSEKRAALSRVTEEVNALSGSEKAFIELSSRLSGIRARRSELQKLAEEYQRRIKDLEARKKEATELKSKVQRLERAVNALKKMREAFHEVRGIPSIIRRNAREMLEDALREILSRFNIEFTDVKLDDSYGVTLVTRTGERSVASLSGGERVALAIAYRLALARVAGGRIGTMILDEPTVHLDEERRRELIDLIRYSTSGTGLQQLIVVTHDREVEEAGDVIVEVYKEGGVSSVRVREVGVEDVAL
jgi:exonuclease SbcC